MEEENEMNISEVIYDPWPEKDELASTPGLFQKIICIVYLLLSNVGQCDF